MNQSAPPLGICAELTHRCPLQCPHCYNPLRLHKKDDELDTETWLSIFDQAADLGVLQVGLSGGEPTLREDLEDFVERLAERRVYSNLITAGVTLTQERLKALAQKGLNHVQISFQSLDAARSDRFTNHNHSLKKKLETAGWARELDLAVTVNAPIHRQNIDEVGRFIEMAAEIGANRIEVAHIQYYGWALHNRAALMPSVDETARAQKVIDAARRRFAGVVNIICAVPDYYAKHPKPCMCGWGREFMTITPAGFVLPCHAAQSIPTLTFDNAKQRSLGEIWARSAAFGAFRGTDWMAEPCRSCERKEVDFGGCRCQAYALAGDAAATDPTCMHSLDHARVRLLADVESASPPPKFDYRRIGVYPA